MNKKNGSFALPQNRVSTPLTLHVHIGSANYVFFFVPLAVLSPRINHHQSGIPGHHCPSLNGTVSPGRFFFSVVVKMRLFLTLTETSILLAHEEGTIFPT